ncbi:MAG: hypothetical protein LBS98_07640 [Coriobacteriales bacterium]|nr:hypothetical protein [Coriobacteriales bacterium]
MSYCGGAIWEHRVEYDLNYEALNRRYKDSRVLLDENENPKEICESTFIMLPFGEQPQQEDWIDFEIIGSDGKRWGRFNPEETSQLGIIACKGLLSFARRSATALPEEIPDSIAERLLDLFQRTSDFINWERTTKEEETINDFLTADVIGGYQITPPVTSVEKAKWQILVDEVPGLMWMVSLFANNFVKWTKAVLRPGSNIVRVKYKTARDVLPSISNPWILNPSPHFCVPLYVMGIAEVEHYSISAPEGTLFYPVNNRKRTKDFENIRVIDCIQEKGEKSEHKPEIKVKASLSPGIASVRIRREWNDEINKPYSRVEYRKDKRDRHSYKWCFRISPVPGRRIIGYPAFHSVVLLLLSLWYFFYQNTISELFDAMAPVSVVTMVLAACSMLLIYVVNQKEAPFYRRKMFQRLAVVTFLVTIPLLLVYGVLSVVVISVCPELINQNQVLVSSLNIGLVIVQGLLCLFSVTWCIRLWKNSTWSKKTRKGELGFQYKPLHLINIKVRRGVKSGAAQQALSSFD